MSMKHIKEIGRQLKRDLPGVVITPLRQERHCVIRVEWQSKSFQAVIATSPKNTDHTIFNAVKEIKQGLQA